MDTQGKAQLRAVLAAYSEALDMLSERLADTGAIVPKAPTWKWLDCGHVVRTDLPAEPVCRSCEAWREDVKAAARDDMRVCWWR